MSYNKKARQNHNIKIVDKLFENVAKSRHLKMTIN
jgi:hypothetical protein